LNIVHIKSIITVAIYLITYKGKLNNFIFFLLNVWSSQGHGPL